MTNLTDRQVLDYIRTHPGCIGSVIAKERNLDLTTRTNLYRRIARLEVFGCVRRETYRKSFKLFATGLPLPTSRSRVLRLDVVDQRLDALEAIVIEQQAEIERLAGLVDGKI